MDTFEEIADERRALADQCATLTPEQQATRSLCEAWSVHDVLAHLIMPLEVSTPKVALAVVLAGGNALRHQPDPRQQRQDHQAPPEPGR